MNNFIDHQSEDSLFLLKLHRSLVTVLTVESGKVNII
jgi:hypothetical protein